ncbi:MAG TPA: fimbrial protein [Rhodanobacteraceae bacterium]
MLSPRNHALACVPFAASFHRKTMLAWLALFALAFLVWPQTGRAKQNGCQPNSNNSTWTLVTFQLPAHLFLQPNAANGTVLWTSAPTPATTAKTFNCNGTTPNGIVNHLGTSPASGDTFNMQFAAPGLSFRIISSAVGGPMTAYSTQSHQGDFVINMSFQLQLVKTGTIASTTTLSSGELARWDAAATNGDHLTLVDFQLGGTTHASPPPCNVAIDPTLVKLPTVATQQFTGPGSTPGKTPFSVKLNQCPSGIKVSITLSTSSPQTGTVGVIAPTAGPGFANNVGVQILKSDGTTPVTFNSAFDAGPATTASDYPIHLYARYYQTDTAVTAGNVKATATYTLTYQ